MRGATEGLAVAAAEAAIARGRPSRVVPGTLEAVRGAAGGRGTWAPLEIRRGGAAERPPATRDGNVLRVSSSVMDVFRTFQEWCISLETINTIVAFKMKDRLYIYCSHPVAADRKLFVEKIDIDW